MLNFELLERKLVDFDFLLDKCLGFDVQRLIYLVCRKNLLELRAIGDLPAIVSLICADIVPWAALWSPIRAPMCSPFSAQAPNRGIADSEAIYARPIPRSL